MHGHGYPNRPKHPKHPARVAPGTCGVQGRAAARTSYASVELRPSSNTARTMRHRGTPRGAAQRPVFEQAGAALHGGREGGESLVIFEGVPLLEGILLPPFQYYKGFSSLPFNITRDSPRY